MYPHLDITCQVMSSHGLSISIPGNRTPFVTGREAEHLVESPVCKAVTSNLFRCPESSRRLLVHYVEVKKDSLGFLSFSIQSTCVSCPLWYLVVGTVEVCGMCILSVGGGLHQKNLKVWRVSVWRSKECISAFVDGVQTENTSFLWILRRGEPPCLPCSHNKLDQRQWMFRVFKVYFLLTVFCFSLVYSLCSDSEE